MNFPFILVKQRTRSTLIKTSCTILSRLLCWLCGMFYQCAHTVVIYRGKRSEGIKRNWKLWWIVHVQCGCTKFRNNILRSGHQWPIGVCSGCHHLASAFTPLAVTVSGGRQTRFPSITPDSHLTHPLWLLNVTDGQTDCQVNTTLTALPTLLKSKFSKRILKISSWKHKEEFRTPKFKGNFRCGGFGRHL